jgi:signal transduction histidine kinase
VEHWVRGAMHSGTQELQTQLESQLKERTESVIRLLKTQQKRLQSTSFILTQFSPELEAALDLAEHKVEQLEFRVRSGKLSLEQAQKALLDELRGASYSKGYLFSITEVGQGPSLILSPQHPEFEGKPLSELAGDSAYFSALSELAQSAGHSPQAHYYVDPSSQQPNGGLWIGRRLAKWPWVVSTGLNLNTLEQHQHRELLQLAHQLAYSIPGIWIGKKGGDAPKIIHHSTQPNLVGRVPAHPSFNYATGGNNFFADAALRASEGGGLVVGIEPSKSAPTLCYAMELEQTDLIVAITANAQPLTHSATRLYQQSKSHTLQSQWISAGLILAWVCFCMALALWLGQRWTKQAKELNQQLQTLSPGSNELKIAPTSTHEFDQLYQQLPQQLQALAQQFEKQSMEQLEQTEKRFLAELKGQALKTPLIGEANSLPSLQTLSHQSLNSPLFIQSAHVHGHSLFWVAALSAKLDAPTCLKLRDYKAYFCAMAKQHIELQALWQQLSQTSLFTTSSLLSITPEGKGQLITTNHLPHLLTRQAPQKLNSSFQLEPDQTILLSTDSASPNQQLTGSSIWPLDSIIQHLSNQGSHLLIRFQPS